MRPARKRKKDSHLAILRLIEFNDEPDRDRTCDPLITYHLGFRRPRRVRGLDYPFTVSLAGFRWTPSSLYAFPDSPGLGSGSPSPEAEGFPDFDAFSLTRFRARLPFESHLLYQLS